MIGRENSFKQGAIEAFDEAVGARRVRPDRGRAKGPRALGRGARLEVDPHHDAPLGGPPDLGEAGGGEDAAAADVELAPGDLLPWLGEHRVALEGTGAALAGEVDGRAGERAADPAAPEARAGDEAGHRP